MQENHFDEQHGIPEAPSADGAQSYYRRAAIQIENDKEKIKASWEKKVRENVQVAEDQTSLALVNSLQTFLDELVEVLEEKVSAHPNVPSEEGMSKSHGGQRATFAGYFLPQLLKEFSILREVLTEDLNKAGVLNFEVRSVIDQSMDSAISLAATEFSRIQQINIEEALKKAEISNRDLELFAAVAAHDLKSPLATISGFLNLLMDEFEEQPGSDAVQYIDRIQKTAERMRNLIDRLLEYARLTSTLKPFQSVAIEDVATAVIQNLHDVIEKTKATITRGRLPTVKGDVDLLNQLFQNLIANGIKFHGDRVPNIQIDSEPQDGMFLISLKDNGIGFDPKDKENIFALFKKSSGKAESQGAGIGLATCRKVVELHGGKIWAESTLGVGSTFYFTLPKAEPESSVPS